MALALGGGGGGAIAADGRLLYGATSAAAATARRRAPPTSLPLSPLAAAGRPNELLARRLRRAPVVCLAAGAAAAAAKTKAGKRRVRRRPIKKGNMTTPVREVPASIPRPPYLGPGNPTSPEQGVPKHEWSYDDRRQVPIQIKGPAEIEGMRAAGAIAREALKFAGSLVYPGGTTEAIDAAVHDFIIARGAYPSPLGYMGYPKTICTSVNDVIAHGIPDDRVLEKGDIMNIDVTVYFDGFHGDTSSMFFVGKPKRSAYELCEASLRARDAGIAVCGPGVDFREIGKAIARVGDETGCHSSGFMRGHGIGSYFHGTPTIIPAINNVDQGLMQPGMTFTIEPVLVENKDDTVELLDDGWTLRTTTASWSAQFEHTLLITGSGHELLTGPDIDYKAISIAAAKKASS